jgi:hypothetical protein
MISIGQNSSLFVQDASGGWCLFVVNLYPMFSFQFWIQRLDKLCTVVPQSRGGLVLRMESMLDETSQQVLTWLDMYTSCCVRYRKGLAQRP